MKITPAIALLIFTFSFLFINSCNNSEPDQLQQHYKEKYFDQADSIKINQSHDATINFIDSVYKQFPFVSAVDKYRYFKYRIRLLEYQNEIPNKNIEVLRFIDSMIYTIEENHLENEMDKQFADAYRLKGTYCLYERRFEEAYIAVSMCRILSEKDGDSCTMSDNYASLGMIKFLQRKYVESGDFIKKSIELSRSCPNNSDQFFRMQGNLDNLALTFDKLDMRDSALKYYLADIEYINSNKHIYTLDTVFPFKAISVVNTNLAYLYRRLNNDSLAEKLLTENHNIFTKNVMDKRSLAEAQTQLARFYIETGNVKSATILLDSAKAMVPIIDNSSKLLWYDLMLRLSKINKDVNSELYYQEQYYVKKDSINKMQYLISSYDPEKEYKRLQQQYELNLMYKDNRVRNAYMVAIVLVLVSVLLLGLSIYLGLRRSQKMVKTTTKLNHELEKNETALKTLIVERDIMQQRQLKEELFLQEVKLQAEYAEAIDAQRRKISIDMHDELSNALAALRFYLEDLINNEKDPKSQNTLVELKEEVNSIYLSTRQYMHNLNAGTSDHHNDVVLFLQDIKSKFEEKNLLQVQLSIDKENINSKLSGNQHNELYHIVKESISNIIKHAHATKASISIQFENNLCKFEILDNGLGMDEKNITYGLGIGSMQQRTQELGGKIQLLSENSQTILKGEFPVLC